MTDKKKQVVEQIKKEIQEELAEASKDERHLEVIQDHIENVQKGCKKLAKKLMEDPDTYDVGFKLLKNSYKHDLSKFEGIEWKYLRTPDLIKEGSCKDSADQKAKFLEALDQHQKGNMHHPEYWGDIKSMPSEYLAEMVCDWNSRSMEFGTDLREWIKKEIPERFGASSSSRVYREIMKFINLLLDQPFRKNK